MHLFDYDGPLMRALIYIGELILLNLLSLLCCLPIVTIGASVTAMYVVTFHNLDGKGSHACRQFLTAFRANFKQATLEWLVMLLAAVLLYVDFCIITQTDFAGKAAVEIVFVCVLTLFFPTLVFLFPIQAYFENTVPRTLKNAVALGLAKFPQSILLLLLNGFPLIFLYFNITVFFRLLPFWAIIGFSGTAQIGTYLFRRIFRNLTTVRKPEEPTQ